MDMLSKFVGSLIFLSSYLIVKSINAEGRRNAASQALSSFDALTFAQDHEPVEWQRAAVKPLIKVIIDRPIREMSTCK